MQTISLSRFLQVVVLILGCAALVAAQGTVPTADANPSGSARPAHPADAAKPDDTKPADAGNVERFTDEIVMEQCGGAGRVPFNHAAHTEVSSCGACHDGIPPVFEKKRSTEGMKMTDMYAGKWCGHCHNGTKAFDAKTSCAKCHQKE